MISFGITLTLLTDRASAFIATDRRVAVALAYWNNTATLYSEWYGENPYSMRIMSVRLISKAAAMTAVREQVSLRVQGLAENLGQHWSQCLPQVLCSHLHFICPVLPSGTQVDA